MPDELDLMQLAAAGELLATVDATDYRAVQLVIAWPHSGAPAVYCSYQDWPAMPAAKLATKERAIAELGQALERAAAEATAQARRAEAALARVAALEAQLAAAIPPPAETPAAAQAAQRDRQAAYIAGDPITCPECGKGGWKNAHALDVHRGRAHAPPQQFVEELGWRCKAKGCTGAHARDLHDPDFCTLHAAPHTNGALVPA